jgi:hypothetical protein
MCARQASSTSVVGAWIGCLAAGLGGVGGLPPNLIPNARRAVQGQCESIQNRGGVLMSLG